MLNERSQLPGFVAANVLAGVVIGSWYAAVFEPGDMAVWRAHSRLGESTTFFAKAADHIDFVKSILVEMLPATIIIGPAIAVAQRRDEKPTLLLAALLYSVTCTVVLIFWPGGVAARYAMPATMTLAVVCGLMFDRWRDEHPRVIVSALVVAYLIFGGLLVRGWVAMPFWPHLFKESEIAGATIAKAVTGNAQPLYVIGTTTDQNMLVYVRHPVRAVRLDDIARLEMPILAVMLPDELSRLLQENPDLVASKLAGIVAQRQPFQILRIDRAR